MVSSSGVFILSLPSCWSLLDFSLPVLTSRGAVMTVCERCAVVAIARVEDLLHVETVWVCVYLWFDLSLIARVLVMRSNRVVRPS